MERIKRVGKEQGKEENNKYSNETIENLDEEARIKWI
jgi:hypothetical protein